MSLSVQSTEINLSQRVRKHGRKMEIWKKRERV